MKLVYAIRKAKDEAWKKLCDDVEHNPWGLPYKLVMGKLSRPPPIPELDIPGRIQKIVHGMFPQHHKRKQQAWPRSLPGEDQWKIDTADLKLAAGILKNNIAPGPDDIPNEAVKIIATLTPNVLESVYNKCLNKGVFPIWWKRARFVLLRKGDRPLEDPSSYRPLCLLDCLGKLFKKIIDNRLRRHLDETEGQDDRQFGFRKGRSTIDALNTLKTIPSLTTSPWSQLARITLPESKCSPFLPKGYTHGSPKPVSNSTSAKQW
ncbi:hypothetical protein QTP88_015041 [Uroleucon formosanum]